MSRRLIFVVMATVGSLAAQDPPSRVGRLNYVEGAVSFQPSGVNDWVPASINRPLTIGDQLYADTGARAEIHVPGAAFRLGSQTAFEIMNLDDRNLQVRLSEGSLNLRVRRVDRDQNLEIDTPNLAFSVDRPGEYRIDTNPDTNQTYVTVRYGEGQVTGNTGAFAVHAREQAVVEGQDQQAQYNVYAAPGNDDFDNWALSRDRREDRSQSARYVSPDVVGYEDLDEYGSWHNTPEYGQYWVPRNTPAGWAPYHDGHWAWVDPWGWSWVDDAPWGFAPSHYGRWAHFGDTWGWVPGPVRVAPVYAPALVAWVGFGGGGGFSASIGFGGGADVGWFPLGPRDVYVPAYGASANYVTRINTSNTTVINNTNITNVYNNYVRTGAVPTANYANRTVPGAVVAVPQNALTSARPVQQVAVRVQPNQISSMRTVAAAPHIAPQVASVLGRAAAPSAPRPTAAVMNRPVVAKSTPPPAPPSFQQRQTLLAKNPGRPLAIQQQRQIATAAPAAVARPQVRVVSQARPVTPPVKNTPAPQPAFRGGAAGAVAQRPGNPPATPLPQNPAARGVPAQAQPPQAAQRPFEPPSAQQRPAQGQPNRPQPNVTPQQNRPFEPPSAQQRTPQSAQPNRPQPNAPPPQQRPLTPNPPVENSRPQPNAQPNRPFQPPSAQQRPAQQNRPVEPARPQPNAQPNRPFEPPSAQQRPPQQNRPVETARPNETPQAQNRPVQPNRPVEPPRPQPNTQPQSRPSSPPPPQPRRVEPQPGVQERNRSAAPPARPAPPSEQRHAAPPPPPQEHKPAPPAARPSEEKKKQPQ